jgi:hypothetical protein
MPFKLAPIDSRPTVCCAPVVWSFLLARLVQPNTESMPSLGSSLAGCASTCGSPSLIAVLSKQNSVISL